jgi:hypothetical protein
LIPLRPSNQSFINQEKENSIKGEKNISLEKFFDAPTPVPPAIGINDIGKK